MDKEYMFNEELFDDEQDFCSKDIDCLTEIDFYQSYDNRVWTSNVEDINGGDNFADYCKYIFKLYEEEGYYD